MTAILYTTTNQAKRPTGSDAPLERVVGREFNSAIELLGHFSAVLIVVPMIHCDNLSNIASACLSDPALGRRFLSRSLLVQRENCEQYREINNGSKEQLPCAGDGALKGKTCAVVKKDASENESPCKVENP